MPRLVLHEHPFASFCQKPLIALYELDVAFERRLVEDRTALARLWPLAKIPVLQDLDADLVLPESSTIIEHVDRLAGGGRLIPGDPDVALQARLWDRVVDEYVAAPMQRIVAEALRAPGQEDPTGVAQARDVLDAAYPTLDARLAGTPWLAGDAFTLPDCGAAPALFYARVVHPWDEATLPHLTRYHGALVRRPSVARVIDEARPYRELFPLPWPNDVDAHQAAPA